MKRKWLFFAALLSAVILLCNGTALAVSCHSCGHEGKSTDRFCAFCGNAFRYNLFIDGHTWANGGTVSMTAKSDGDQVTINQWSDSMGYSSNQLKLHAGQTYRISYRITAQKPMQVLTKAAHAVSPWTVYYDEFFDVQPGVVNEFQSVFHMDAADDSQAELVIMFVPKEERTSPFTLKIWDVNVVSLQ